MNTKVWYLPYFVGTRMIKTILNAKARMVHTMILNIKTLQNSSLP